MFNSMIILAKWGRNKVFYYVQLKSTKYLKNVKLTAFSMETSLKVHK